MPPPSKPGARRRWTSRHERHRSRSRHERRAESLVISDPATMQAAALVSNVVFERNKMQAERDRALERERSLREELRRKEAECQRRKYNELDWYEMYGEEKHEREQERRKFKGLEQEAECRARELERQRLEALRRADDESRAKRNAEREAARLAAKLQTVKKLARRMRAPGAAGFQARVAVKTEFTDTEDEKNSRRSASSKSAPSSKP